MLDNMSANIMAIAGKRANALIKDIKNPDRIAPPRKEAQTNLRQRRIHRPYSQTEQGNLDGLQHAVCPSPNEMTSKAVTRPDRTQCAQRNGKLVIRFATELPATIDKTAIAGESAARRFACPILTPVIVVFPLRNDTNVPRTSKP
jgi:hypothetical protein